MPGITNLFLFIGTILLIAISSILPSGRQNLPETEENNKLRELLSKTFPISKYLVTFSIFLSGLYFFILYVMSLNSSYIEFLFVFNNYLVIFVFFIIFLSIFSFFILKEYKNASQEIHRKRPYLLISIIFLLFSLSGITAISFCCFINTTLNFSSPTEEIVKVINKNYTSGYKTTTKHYIYINPSICKIVKFRIPGDKYTPIKIGDILKFKVYTGSLGIKYTKSEFELNN